MLNLTIDCRNYTAFLAFAADNFAPQKARTVSLALQKTLI